MNKTIITAIFFSCVISLPASASTPDSSTKEAPQTVPVAAQMCVSCHGAQGQGMDVAGPKLAGLSAAYMVKQIKLFQSGSRQSPLMQPMAMMVQGDAIQVVADYFASQPVDHVTLRYRGDKLVMTEPAEKLAYQGDWSRDIPACFSCHGPSAVGAELFPRLAGQQASYIKSQLEAWQKGTRKGDTDNVMGKVASKLTATEIDALAHYFTSLK
ncbi:c-type cytochrome [Shewanella sp. OMA3-2]|uniref:c-type cytochrome n=1 Tax=Shewanella sp. OMA3-2 TaxID=2908650 RepID=UPI003FA6BCD4